MEKDKFITELRRALLTEEEMAKALFELTAKELRNHGASEGVIKDLAVLLDTIKAETTLHAEAVRGLIARFEKGPHHG